MKRSASIALAIAASATLSAQTVFNLGVVSDGFAFNIGNTPAYPVVVTPAVITPPAVVPCVPGYIPTSRHAAAHLRKAAEHYAKATHHYLEAGRRATPAATFATPCGTIYIGAPAQGYYVADDDCYDHRKHHSKHHKKQKKHHNKHHDKHHRQHRR